MKIGTNTVVTVQYAMSLEGFEGEMIEATEQGNPFTFLYNSGEMLAAFEEEILGKEKGNDFKFSIKPENAFGEYDEESIMEFPKDVFSIDGKFDKEVIFEGNIVPMKDQEGNTYDATILEVGKDNIKVDFNHPLAGEELFITGKIEDVREATADEIKHGHVHRDE